MVVWNMNFMTSLRVGMIFFNLTFTPSFFRRVVLPNHQPDEAWHHGRMGPWPARTLHPSSRMSTVGGSTRRTAAMSTVGEAPQLD